MLNPAPHAAAEALLDRAMRCRRLARLSTDRRATEALTALATEYELKAVAARHADQGHNLSD